MAAGRWVGRAASRSRVVELNLGQEGVHGIQSLRTAEDVPGLGERVCRVRDRAASSAMQIHGAFAYTEEYGIERIFRDMKLAEIYEGVNESQRVIAAAELLR